MTDISASQARKQFADLLRKASSGETFTIVREGYPVATLGPPANTFKVPIPSDDIKLGTHPDYRPAATTQPTTGTASATNLWQQRQDRLAAEARARLAEKGQPTE